MQTACRKAAAKPLNQSLRCCDGPGPLLLWPRWRIGGLLASAAPSRPVSGPTPWSVGSGEGLLIMVAEQLRRLGAHMEHAEIGPEGGGGGREAAQMVWLGGREPSVPTRLAEWATCAASLAALAARPASGGCSSLVGRGSPGDGIAGGPVLAETASRWSSDHRGSVSATPAGWPRAV